MTADLGTVYGRGLGFNFGLAAAGTIALSQGPQNIRESLEIILATEPGERLMRPAFGAGLRQFLYEPNNAATHRLIEERIVRAIERWEPRVRLESVDVSSHATQRASAIAEVRYRLVATGDTATINVGVAVDQGVAT